MSKHPGSTTRRASLAFAAALLFLPYVSAAQEPAPGTPGSEHEELASLAGTWEVSVSEQPAGTARAATVLDGRFLRIEIMADAGPVTHAIYTFGFDRRYGRYIVSAMDDSGTYWVSAQGARDGSAIRMYGKDDDPVMTSMGYEKEFAIVLHLHEPDRVEIETLFIDTRTPERNALPFMSFDLRRTEADLSADVRRTELAFAATMADRDLDAFTSFVADEAVFIGGGGAMRGVEAIRDGWNPYFEAATAPFAWVPDRVEVLESGELARSTGPIIDSAGRLIGTFSSIWRRNPGGDWQVVFDKGCEVCAGSE